MADNTSATGGYLSPQSADNLVYDLAFDTSIQALIAGITGLPGDMVRPRWQPKTPKEPEADNDWCAVAVTGVNGDFLPAVTHSGADQGSSELRRHEDTDLLASFYGPNSGALASIFRDGIGISQNRERMQLNGIGLVSTGRLVMAPALINQTWRRRTDFDFTLRRVVSRTYSILNLLRAQGTLHTETLTEPFDTENH